MAANEPTMEDLLNKPTEELTEGDINMIALGGLHVIPPGHSRAIPLADHVAQLDEAAESERAALEHQDRDEKQRGGKGIF